MEKHRLSLLAITPRLARTSRVAPSGGEDTAVPAGDNSAMDHLAACDALEGEIDRFATVLADGAMNAAVPTCPGWNVADLSLHLGTVHRWAEHLVRMLAPIRVPSDAMGLSTGPVDEQWIRTGGAALVSTLRAADPTTPMWAWGADQHVAFWSRRQLHETLVHRTDLELARGMEPTAGAGIAADAIDEFLVNLAPAARFSPKVEHLRGKGERLALFASDADRSWTVLLSPDGFSVRDIREDGGPISASFVGASLPLLLVLYRRRAPAAAGVSVTGDHELAEFWLANSALE